MFDVLCCEVFKNLFVVFRYSQTRMNTETNQILVCFALQQISGKDALSSLKTAYVCVLFVILAGMECNVVCFSLHPRHRTATVEVQGWARVDRLWTTMEGEFMLYSLRV